MDCKFNLFAKTKKVLFIIAVFTLLLILSMFSKNHVEASTRFGDSYLLDGNYITKIMPETTVNDFKTNLGINKMIKITDKNENELSDTSIIGTDMTCKIENDTYKLVVLGDITGDGKITISDVVKVKLNTIKMKLLNGSAEKAADITGDGKLTISDVVAINLLQVKIKDIKDYELTTGVYVKLYDDGTLVFTDVDRLIDGKTLFKSYGNIYNLKIEDIWRDIPWCYEFDSIKTVDIADKVYIKNATGLFALCQNLRTINNMTNMYTDNVTDMSNMFYACKDLTSLDLSNFTTSNVTNMYGMFGGCSSLTSLNLSNFNTTNVTVMASMFVECGALTSLDLSNFNTANVTSMNHMFADCESLAILDLSNFDTKNIDRDANAHAMTGIFVGCTNLNTIYVGDDWNTENINTKDMFTGCATDKVTVKNSGLKSYMSSLRNVFSL